MKTKKYKLIPALLVWVCLLTGCAFENSVEEMFTLPQVPLEYSGLMQELSALTADGYEYLSPASGKTTQSVQMVDLTGDGEDEAVAFFRRSSDEKPLKIFIYQGVGADFELLCTIASSGSSIDSVSYADLTGDGKPELIVGWKIGADVQTLTVYSIGREYISLVSSPYIRFALQDIDGSGERNLLTIRSDNELGSVCECYEWQRDSLCVTSRAALSSTAADISRGTVISGELEDEEQALFITGVDDELNAMTDILVCRQQSGLLNIAADKGTGKTHVIYPNQQLPPKDINGDGITEIPSPVVDNVLHQNMVAWFAYRSSGMNHQVAETYHSQTQGWYFSMPKAWWGKASAISQETAENENCVTISVEGQEMIQLYTLTGEDREMRSTMDGRFLISRQPDTNYAGKLLQPKLAEITADELRHSLYLTGNTWAENSL